MKYLLFLFSTLCFAQTKPQIETLFLDKTQIKGESLITIDNYGANYYLNNNTLTKETKASTYTYSNIQLGNITSANTFNPLRISLFYKDFNTVIILDNRLAEIFKIDFNRHPNYKNVSYVSTGSDNTIWVFNQDTQQLELFDYKDNNIRIITLPISSNVLDLKSNYNYSWLLTEDFLYNFNYFGSFLFKIKNDGFTEMAGSNGNLILKKEGKLFYLKKSTIQPIEIQLPKLLINAFFVNDETLYIYDSEFLYKYQIKTN